MTDPIITMQPAEISVQPGAQQRVEITIRNPGSLVEDYQLEVLDDTTGGGPAAWAQVVPQTLQVYPGESASAAVVFTPPEGIGAPTGRFGIAVRAVSTVSADARAVAEGQLEVGQVFGLQATIAPTTSTGRWRGHHVVRFTNWGNSPVRLRLAARDPDERLGFLLQPGEVHVPLGGTATARLTVRTRKPFLRGTVTRLPFEVVGEPDEPRTFGRPEPSLPGDPRRPVLNGAFTQKPILGRTTVAIAMLAVAALVGAVVLALKRPPSTPHFPLSLGWPATPKGVTVSPVSDGSIRVKWSSVSDVIGYKVLNIDPRDKTTIIGQTEVSADQRGYQTSKLTALTEYCYAVEAIRNSKRQSDPSKPQCTKAQLPRMLTSGSTVQSASSSPSSSASGSSGSSGSPPPSSSTSSPTGPPTGSSSTGGPLPPQINPGDWVWLVGGLQDYSSPADSQHAYDLAQGRATQLFINDHVRISGVLGSSQFPQITVLFRSVPTHFWAPFYGPFSTTALYDNEPLLCQNNLLVCLPAQPKP